MPVIQYGNIAGIVKSFTEPLDELGNPKRYLLWAREQVEDGDEVDILYYDWAGASWEPLIGNLSIENLTDTDISGLASNDTLQWNGTDWENRQNITVPGTLQVDGITTLNDDLSIGNLTLNEGLDAIQLNAATLFSVKNSSDANLLTVDEATGNVGVPIGTVTINSGGLNVSSSIVANGASSINNALQVSGNLTVLSDIIVGDITIDESATSILSTGTDLTLQRSAGSVLTLGQDIDINLLASRQFAIFDSGAVEIFAIDES
jgi:hypothetical protein